MHRLQLFLLLAALPAAGFLYQWAGARRDKKRLLPHGTLFDVGEGRRMYLSQAGAGYPTVIFESGIAATSQNWAHLQESVSSIARTVTYDRAGLGWSGPCASDRTPSNIVRELRALLRHAGIPPPYILVGHSFGGLVVQRFAAEHASEVLGLVLIDPMRPEDWQPMSDAQRAELERGLRLTRIAIPSAHLGLARLAATSLLCNSGKISGTIGRATGAGGRHVLDRVTSEVGKMPKRVRPIVAAHWSNPGFYRGLAAHLNALPASIREMLATKPIENIPVLLLTPASTGQLSYERLSRIGQATQQVLAEKSGHWIHLDEPDLVAGAVRSMIELARTNIEAIRHTS